MVLHKHGEELYSAVEAVLASEVEGLGKALDTAPDGTLFLQDLLAKWHQHKRAVSLTRDVVMYMDQTFVPMEHKKPVYELGLHLWRDRVICSDRVQPRLIEAVRRERASEETASTAVPGGLIAGVTEMLKELGDEVYHEVMDVGDEVLHFEFRDPADERLRSYMA